MAILAMSTFSFGKVKVEKAKYHRSSLHTIFVEMDNTGDGVEKNAIILDAYQKMPFPDKYDNMQISEVIMSPKDFTITEEDRLASTGKKKKGFGLGVGKMLKSVTSEFIPDLDGEGAADLKIKIDKYMKTHKIANQLVAKWYNRKADGSFDTKLIGERGHYDANLLDVKVAGGLARGSAALEDAGFELIENTFVVVTRMKYVRNEVIADAIKIMATKLPSYAQTAAVLFADGFMKEGYSVWTKSFLYKLKWNKDIQSRFYADYWIDKNNLDPAKKKAFDESDLFEMEYIGKESALRMITKTVGEALGTTKKEVRNQDDLIREAAVRSIDRVYVKLQKHHDVFKPKIPLFSGDPITAKIGKKEGLKGGEKFEVMEQVLDPKTGKTKYVKKGIIKVSKKKGKIWDNRYSLDGSVDKDGVTYFEGKANKFYPGMLIRQKK